MYTKFVVLNFLRYAYLKVPDHAKNVCYCNKYTKIKL